MSSRDHHEKYLHHWWHVEETAQLWFTVSHTSHNAWDAAKSKEHSALPFSDHSRSTRFPFCSSSNVEFVLDRSTQSLPHSCNEALGPQQHAQHREASDPKTNKWKKLTQDNKKVPWEVRKTKEDYVPLVDFSVQEGQVVNPILNEFGTALMSDLGKLLEKANVF